MSAGGWRAGPTLPGYSSSWIKYKPAKGVSYVMAWRKNDGTWTASAADGDGTVFPWCPGATRKEAAEAAIAKTREDT